MRALVEAGQGPATTSVGRLFDALGSLVTGRVSVGYEAQAAIELEALARHVPRADLDPWPGAMPIEEGADGLVLDARPLVAEVVAACRDGVAREVVAGRIHETIGSATAEAAARVAADAGLSTVALTGGAFQNVRLTNVVRDALEAAGLEVLVHRTVPPNDGGISVGQAAVAATRA